MFTVKQLSQLAGVTPRTLHHYDEIGLLKPSRVGDNGYRYYGEEAVLRLQQILFYRELDIPLEDIKKIMGRRDFDVLGALQSHKDALKKQAARLNRLIDTVDNTILYLKGNKEMSNKQLFEAFSDEQQAEYEKEIAQKYDPETIKASTRKWKQYTAAEKQRIGEEGNAAYQAILAAFPKGAASPEAQAGIERWRKHIEYFWIPNDAQLLGLANLYNEDSRFKANFDKIDPRLAEFMREAVKVYVSNRKK
ncbi:MAG TPA: MerR family transcriptional regulator [Anaerolineales bacterium]|nr:MerR family transcriptional regulator [Anaerolineales bacterium]